MNSVALNLLTGNTVPNTGNKNVSSNGKEGSFEALLLHQEERSEGDELQALISKFKNLSNEENILLSKLKDLSGEDVRLATTVGDLEITDIEELFMLLNTLPLTEIEVSEAIGEESNGKLNPNSNQIISDEAGLADYDNSFASVQLERQKVSENIAITNLSNGNTRVQIQEIVAKFEALLTNLENKADLPKISSKVLELLRQWSELENKQVQASNLDNNVKTKEQLIWKDLFQAFEKRNNLSGKNLYQVDSEVTSQDVMKWLEKAFEKYDFTIKQPMNTLQTGQALSKVEQYVVYLNPSNEAKPVNEELLKQFQSIIDSSRFLSKPNGMNQLSIVLKPDHLGEMRIRLVQVNGEMTVKFIVASQAAKELLETNVNQLRNMFLPHQVTIEKQELQLPNNSIANREEANEQNQDDHHDDSEESREDSNQSSDKDSELKFSELLMNLKV